jgi:hypothetical protein
VIFVPTVQLQFLHVLKRYFPNHHLLLADFNFLPGALNGENGPVVSRKSSQMRGRTIDAPDYLMRTGCHDIFFPTNFLHLQHLYCQLVGSSLTETQIFEQFEFMKKYANVDKTRTQSGYNPLLLDYSNFSFFVATMPTKLDK